MPGQHTSNCGKIKVGYSVEEGQETMHLDSRLPVLQHADLRDKVVLLRVDHNVLKKGSTDTFHHHLQLSIDSEFKLE